MHHLILACLFAGSATLTAAAPTGHPDIIHMHHDDVLLYGEGGLRKVMRRSEYEEYKAANPFPPAPPIDETLPRLVGNQLIPGRPDGANTTATPHQKRDNLETLFILPGTGADQYSRYTDWDLLISNVVVPGNQNDGRITCTMGRSVANSVTGGGGIDLGKIQKLLSISADVHVSTTKTRDGSSSISLPVNKGMYSIMVANPYKYSRKGYVWTGNVGESERGAGVITPFTTSEYKTGAAGPMDWVMGEIGVAQAYTNDIPCRVGNCKALDRVDVGNAQGQA